MHFRTTLSGLWSNIQQQLFPMLEKYVGPLPAEYRKLVAILEIIKIEESMPCTRFNFGRPCKDRAFIARAFIAKKVLKLTYTKQIVNLLRQDRQLKIICGWDSTSEIPSESKFSRVFSEFAANYLPDRVHQSLIREVYKDQIIGHVVCDSTTLIGREKPLKKEGTPKERKKQANDRYLREKKGELSRRQKQMKQPLSEMFAELPKSCDIGRKKNAQGFSITCKGRKLHLAVDDLGMPLAAHMTSASLNDSEAAIPLMAKVNKVVTYFYDLMDSAYDVPEIKEYSRGLGHVPIIDIHARSKAQKEDKNAEQKRKHLLNAFTAEDKRYKERFSKERVNGIFKEYYGGRNIQYKGHDKVFCHAMFGLLALSANILLKFIQ